VKKYKHFLSGKVKWLNQSAKFFDFRSCNVVQIEENRAQSADSSKTCLKTGASNCHFFVDLRFGAIRRVVVAQKMRAFCEAYCDAHFCPPLWLCWSTHSLESMMKKISATFSFLSANRLVQVLFRMDEFGCFVLLSSIIFQVTLCLLSNPVWSLSC